MFSLMLLSTEPDDEQQFIAAANANVVLLEFVTLFEIPPLFLLVSQAKPQANRFLLFLIYAFSGFAKSFVEDVVEASLKLVNDFDFPL